MENNLFSSKNPLQNRLVKGIGAQGFAQIVQIVVRLGEVPLFLSFWGAEKYGEWLMLAAIPTYLAMSDGGFTQTACRDITIKASAGDKEGALKTYQSIWMLLLFLMLFIGIISGFVAKFVSINELLNFSIMTQQETAFVFLILVFFVLIGFQSGLMNSGFWAVGNYPQSMFFNSIIQLTSFIGMALGLCFHGGPIQVALGYLFGKIIGTIIMAVAQYRNNKWLTLGFKKATFSEIRRLVVPSFATLAFPVGSSLNVQGIRLVIGLVLGPTYVAIFAPLRTLANFVGMPSTIIRALTEPEMAMAFGSEKKEKYQQIFIQSVRFAFWTCVLSAVFLTPLGKWLFQIWTANKVLFNWPTFILLVISQVIDSIWLVALMVSYSTNRHGSNALYYMLIFGFAFVILGFFSCRVMGIVGPAITLILVESIMDLLVFPQAVKLSGLSMNKDLMFKFLTPPFKEIWYESLSVYKKFILYRNIETKNSNS